MITLAEQFKIASDTGYDPFKIPVKKDFSWSDVDNMVLEIRSMLNKVSCPYAVWSLVLDLAEQLDDNRKEQFFRSIAFTCMVLHKPYVCDC